MSEQESYGDKLLGIYREKFADMPWNEFYKEHLDFHKRLRKNNLLNDAKAINREKLTELGAMNENGELVEDYEEKIRPEQTKPELSTYKQPFSSKSVGRYVEIGASGDELEEEVFVLFELMRMVGLLGKATPDKTDVRDENENRF